MIISIHAPTRGATPAGVPYERTDGFQSTLPQGERLDVLTTILNAYDFNPRSHKGSDDLGFIPRKDREIISIHAPTRRATALLVIVNQQDFISIHAPTRGATIKPPRHWNGIFISIHAPTRGATTPSKCAPSNFLYFNPRSHKGSDRCHITRFGLLHISIHAPTRGATTPFLLFVVPLKISIHAPTRGATVPLRPVLAALKISIHAPTRGAT